MNKDTMDPDRDVKFASKVQSSFETVQSWDSPENVETISKIRASLPWNDLYDAKGAFSNPETDERLLSEDLKFVQRLARHFKKTMTWVNSPACQHCNSTESMEHVSTRVAETNEEKEGQATRVEVHKCTSCNDAETEFGRYNACSKLFQEKRGRCGEYANLFGLYCRAVGLDTRYVLDWTDHVWTEVRIGGQYIMVDSCEAVVDEPSMYEHGWGKSLTVILAFSNDSVVDVTPRYTRNFASLARREVTTSEVALEQTLFEINQKLWRDKPHHRKLVKDAVLSEKALHTLQQRVKRENAQLERLKTLDSWTEDNHHLYEHGRISGSTAWKQARREMGNNKDQDNPLVSSSSSSKDNETTLMALKQPPYMPRTTNDVICISIHPKAKDRRFRIQRNETPCALVTGDGGKISMYVAVFSPPELGCCLWQSLLVRKVSDLAAYVATLPQHSILAMTGLLTASEKGDYKSSWNRLGGFHPSCLVPETEGETKHDDNDNLVYLGQLDANPSWTVCGKAGDQAGDYPRYQITATMPAVKDLCLAEYPGVCPASIVGRLECSASLSLAHKQAAFWSSQDAKLYSGFVTKADAPVYLLGETACPMTPQRLEHENNDNSSMWTTCLRLPKDLVSPGNRVDPGSLVPVATQEPVKKNDQPGYQVPVDLDFFHNQIGTELVTSGGARLPTAVVLDNIRLVGLYFSAHWCGPCRSFTPLLAEAYQTWKEHCPNHGLEILFVSSDRDQASFDGYSRSMPWSAIPFDTLPRYKHALSDIYGVRGIPSLVILDAVSGQVVVPAQASRNKVMQATRQGSVGLERLLDDWLVRVPAPTIELLQMLQASCQEHTAAPQKVEPQRQDDDDSSSLYLNGKVPAQPSLPLRSGPHDTLFKRVVPSNNNGNIDYLNQMSKVDRKQFLDTVLKYVDNCRANPWVVKYRHFRVSNKVVDRGISRIPHALTVLQSIFGLLVSLDDDEDYSILIPVSCNLDKLREKLLAHQEK